MNIIIIFLFRSILHSCFFLRLEKPCRNQQIKGIEKLLTGWYPFLAFVTEVGQLLLHPGHISFITVEGVATLIMRQVHWCLVLRFNNQESLPLYFTLLQSFWGRCSCGFIIMATYQTTQVDVTIHPFFLTGSEVLFITILSSGHHT